MSESANKPPQQDTGDERSQFDAAHGYAAQCESDYRLAAKEYQRTGTSRACNEMFDAEYAWGRALRAEKRHTD